MDILTRENLSLIELANMDIIHWSVRSTSRRGGDGFKGYLYLIDRQTFIIQDIMKYLEKLDIDT